MAVMASRYYGCPFHVSRGVTQGGPLSPCIFNVVVDAIFFHWVGLVTENKASPDGFKYTVGEDSESFFSSNDVLVASTNLVWMQWDFNIIIGIFK